LARRALVNGVTLENISIARYETLATRDREPEEIPRHQRRCDRTVRRMERGMAAVAFAGMEYR